MALHDASKLKFNSNSKFYFFIAFKTLPSKEESVGL
jgi:hypothetical protein